MQAAPKFLFFFAGYESDCDKALGTLRKRLVASSGVEDVVFDWRKRHNAQHPDKYWKSVADAVIDIAFGKSGATGYCGLDVSCIQDAAIVRGRRCSKPQDNRVACRKLQPTGITLFVPPEQIEAVMGFFGSSVMIVEFDGIKNDEHLFHAALAAYVRMKSIKDYFESLPLEKKAVFLPHNNFFQPLHIQTQLSTWKLDIDFGEEADALHKKYYNHTVQNPEKKQLRGGYLFDKNIFFQRDRLHDQAKLGQESRKHGYHLLKAYFRFGMAVRPGMHFDVMREDGKALKKRFTDVLTGEQSLTSATHINISPCDRLL